MSRTTPAHHTNTGRESAVEAVGRFIDAVSPVVGDFSSRKAVLDAALVLAQELMSAREVLRPPRYLTGGAVNRRAGNVT